MALNNLKKLKWASFFSNCMLILSFVSAYLLTNRFSSFEIMSSQSFFLLLILLLEVPSGGFSDRFGAKLSLTLSSLAALLGWLSIYHIQGLWNLFLYQFFFALHSSLLSGSLESYLYQSLEGQGREDEFKRYLLDLSSVKYAAMILAGLLGSLLFKFGSFRLLMQLTLMTSSIALLFMFLLKESPEEQKEREQKKLGEILVQAMALFRREGAIFWLIWDSILFGSILASFFHMHQIILKSRGFPVRMNGVYTTIIFVLSILILQFYNKQAAKKDNELTIAMVINLFMTLLVVAIVITRHPLVTALLWILLFSLRFFKRPLLQVMINKHIQSYSRATSLSLLAFMENMGGILLAPLLGYFFDRPNGILPIGIIVCFCLMSGFVFLGLQQKRERQ